MSDEMLIRKDWRQRMEKHNNFDVLVGPETDPLLRIALGWSFEETTLGPFYSDAISGNDANPGTIGSPVETIHNAIAKIVIGTNDDAINIRGTYTERVALGSVFNQPNETVSKPFHLYLYAKDGNIPVIRPPDHYYAPDAIIPSHVPGPFANGASTSASITYGDIFDDLNNLFFVHLRNGDIGAVNFATGAATTTEFLYATRHAADVQIASNNYVEAFECEPSNFRNQEKTCRGIGYDHHTTTSIALFAARRSYGNQTYNNITFSDPTGFFSMAYDPNLQLPGTFFGGALDPRSALNASSLGHLANWPLGLGRHLKTWEILAATIERPFSSSVGITAATTMSLWRWNGLEWTIYATVPYQRSWSLGPSLCVAGQSYVDLLGVETRLRGVGTKWFVLVSDGATTTGGSPIRMYVGDVADANFVHVTPDPTSENQRVHDVEFKFGYYWAACSDGLYRSDDAINWIRFYSSTTHFPWRLFATDGVLLCTARPFSGSAATLWVTYDGIQLHDDYPHQGPDVDGDLWEINARICIGGAANGFWTSFQEALVVEYDEGQNTTWDTSTLDNIDLTAIAPNGQKRCGTPAKGGSRY